MKLLTILTTLALLTTGAFSVALTDEEAIAARKRTSDPTGSLDLLKRDCNHDTPCKGNGWSPGLHCGDGSLGCKKGHVYQVDSATNYRHDSQVSPDSESVQPSPRTIIEKVKTPHSPSYVEGDGGNV
ncbi:hypothetical protein CPB86DRAFT_830645 [Serendipita vermifera]|nr:hypothetical protein CPB86DRAFT_830645 [Serendipita vermifera]